MVTADYWSIISLWYWRTGFDFAVTPIYLPIFYRLSSLHFHAKSDRDFYQDECRIMIDGSCQTMPKHLFSSIVLKIGLTLIMALFCYFYSIPLFLDFWWGDTHNANKRGGFSLFLQVWLVKVIPMKRQLSIGIFLCSYSPGWADWLHPTRPRKLIFCQTESP